MLFSVILLLIIGLVAYFHYLQGLFSATLSAILAVTAALLSVGWHETVVDMMLRGAVADYAHAITLAGTFILYYALLRFLFDKLLPGNVRFPLLVDKIGSAAAGAVAGVVCAGVVAITAQTLPLSESIIGWTRYQTELGREAMIAKPERYRSIVATYNLVAEDRFRTNDPDGLLLPVDDWLLGLVKLVSRPEGSLFNGRPLEDGHPDYLQELFGQRAGIPAGFRHTALKGSVRLDATWLISGELALQDQERFEIEVTGMGLMSVGIRTPKNQSDLRSLPARRGPAANSVFIVLRVIPEAVNADKQTSLVCFSPASARLCVPGENADGRFVANYFPVGTLEGSNVLYVAAVDDTLLAQPEKAIDLVYELPKSALNVEPKTFSIAFYPGAFLEFKRLARVALDTAPLPSRPDKPNTDPGLLRKRGGPGGRTIGGATVAVGSLNFSGAPRTDGRLPGPLGVAEAGDNQRNGTADWGSYSFSQRRFTDLEVRATRSLRMMGESPNGIELLGAPENQRILILTAETRGGGDPWAWLNDVREYAVVDHRALRYAPSGVLVKLLGSGAQEFLSARYQADRTPVDYRPDADARGMRPREVSLVFVVPAGTQITSLVLRQDVVRSVNITLD